MHIAIIYDCMFPWTIGGAERWYRNVAESLAQNGHSVDYLTLRQWDRGDDPVIAGVRVIAVGPRLSLYRDGKRRIIPPLLFGIGVAWHLLRKGRSYHSLHMASFPFFSLLAAGLLRPFFRYSISVDWHEVWSRQYWTSYLGNLGVAGWWVQKLCARVPHAAFSFSRLHLARLRVIGREGTLLPGEYAGGTFHAMPAADPPTLLYAGRLIREKRIDLLVDAFAIAYRARPNLRLRIVGQGPEEVELARQIAVIGLGKALELAGFVSEEQLKRWMSEAIAVVQPSKREGYGMVVVEAAAHGVPAIVVEGEDNAAVELVEAGCNGIVSAANPEALAAAIEAIAEDPQKWRDAAAAWFRANRQRLSLANSLDIVSASVADKNFRS